MPTSAARTPRARLENCDRCPALAWIVARLPSGGELRFCGTHARLHARRLLQIGAGLTSAF